METLLPVIVGGSIGLVGGFVGPWFLQKAKEGSFLVHVSGRLLCQKATLQAWLEMKEAAN